MIWSFPKLIMHGCISHAHLYDIPYLVTIIHFGPHNFRESPFVLDNVVVFDFCRIIMPFRVLSSLYSRIIFLTTGQLLGAGAVPRLVLSALCKEGR